MATSRRRIKFQLYELGDAGAMRKKLIQDTGGFCYVSVNGDPAKAAITDKDGTTLANPRPLTNGSAEVWVLAATVSKVDLYIMAPGGQFIVVQNVDEGIADIGVDTTIVAQTAVIPFALADTTAAVETDTGFDLPSKAIVLDRLHGMGVSVKTLDSGHNILFGLLASEGGGAANGFSTNLSLTTAVLKTGVNGSFFSTNAPYNVDSAAARSISYTLDAGTTVGKGFILLPYRLVAF